MQPRDAGRSNWRAHPHVGHRGPLHPCQQPSPTTDLPDRLKLAEHGRGGMLGSLIFARPRYSLTIRAMARYGLGAMPTCAEKKWVKWLCDANPSSNPMSVIDACDPTKRSSAFSMRFVFA